MTTTRYFKSSDSGAPVLSGQTGSLIALLHACLVGTAGVAYGSGPTAKAAAGWSEPFTNTSTKGVFKNSSAGGGTGMHCRVLDDGSLSGSTFREAGMFSYATMSDLDTGTVQTPQAATLAAGVIIRKSATADGTVRAWRLVADELTWYLEIQANATAGVTETQIYGGGDIASEIPSDGKRFFALGRITANVVGGNATWMNAATNFGTPASNGFYIGSGYAQTGNPVSLALASINISGNAIGGSIAGQTDPSPGSSNRYFIPQILCGESTIRGRLRGIYAALNNLSAVAYGTEIAGPTGLPAGSNLLIAHVTGGQTGSFAIETALSW